MLKIKKYSNLTRYFSQSGKLRSSCEKECPPRYECKQPEPSDYDKEFEILKKSMIPPICQEKCHKDGRIYRNIFFFVCIPILAFHLINVFYLHPEPIRRPKFLPFPYLRIRNKSFLRNTYRTYNYCRADFIVCQVAFSNSQPFPWDPVRTLFHNPKVNALPDGYEEEVSEEEEYDPFEPEK